MNPHGISHFQCLHSIVVKTIQNKSKHKRTVYGICFINLFKCDQDLCYCLNRHEPETADGYKLYSFKSKFSNIIFWWQRDYIDVVYQFVVLWSSVYQIHMNRINASTPSYEIFLQTNRMMEIDNLILRILVYSYTWILEYVNTRMLE